MDDDESHEIVTVSSGYNEQTKDDIAEQLSNPLEDFEIAIGDQLIKKQHPLQDQEVSNLFKFTKELKHCLFSDHQKKDSRGNLIAKVGPI